MTDQELNRLISSLQSSVGAFTNSIDSTRRQMERSAATTASAEAKETKEFEERLKRLGKWNKAEDAERMEELRQHRAHLKRLQEVEQRQRDQIAKHITKSQEHERAMEELRKDRVKALEAQKIATRKGDVAAADKAKKLADDQLKQINLLRKAKNAERDASQKLTRKLNADLVGAAKIQQSITNRMKQVEGDLSKFSWKEMGKKVGSEVGGELLQGVKNVLSTLTLTNAMTGAFNNLSEVMATGGDNVLASLSKQFDIAALGISPDEYVKMNATSRQSILAAGGANKQLEILAHHSDSLRGHFKTLGDATKYTQGQMDLLASAGIKPSKESAGLLNESFKKMKAYTGMTGEEFNKLNESLVADSEIQLLLRSASMEERKQIMATNAARIAERVALGMTTDQAKEVTKSLAKMSGLKPIDRVKKSAQIRMIGSALGIEGTEAAAQAALKANPNDDDKAAMEKVFAAVSKQTTDARQSNNFQLEMMHSALLGNTNMEEWMGPRSVHNTALTEGKAFPKEALDAQIKVPDILERLISATNAVQAAIKNPAVQATGGVANSIWSNGGQAAAGAAGLWGLQKTAPHLAKLLPGSAAATGAATGGAGLAGAGLAGAAGTAALALGGGYAIDAGFGALGIGKKKVDEAQDDANWNAATTTEKMQSAIPRGIEKLGSLFFLDNLINDARATRIADETKYLQEKLGVTPGTPIAPSSDSTYSGKRISPDEQLAQSANQPRPGTAATTTPSLTSSETRAESTSPIGLQLAKMEESNQYLKDLTQLSTKQLELAEKQLAATVVSQEDKAELFKSLASGNKFMTSYSTIA